MLSLNEKPTESPHSTQSIRAKTFIPVSCLDKVDSFVRIMIQIDRAKKNSQKYFILVNTSIVMFLFKFAHTFYLARKKIETKWLITKNKDNVRHFFGIEVFGSRALDYIAIPLWNYADFFFKLIDGFEWFDFYLCYKYTGSHDSVLCSIIQHPLLDMTKYIQHFKRFHFPATLNTKW